MIFSHRKIGGLHFVQFGPYGFSFHRKRNVVPLISGGMVGAAIVGAVLLTAVAAAPAALRYAQHEGTHARWMLTHRDFRTVRIDRIDLRFDDCMALRANGQRCRLQPKGGIGQ